MIVLVGHAEAWSVFPSRHALRAGGHRARRLLPDRHYFVWSFRRGAAGQVRAEQGHEGAPPQAHSFFLRCCGGSPKHRVLFAGGAIPDGMLEVQKKCYQARSNSVKYMHQRLKDAEEVLTQLDQRGWDIWHLTEWPTAAYMASEVT